MVRDPLTHISIVSSRNKEFVVFGANSPPRAVKKVMVDQRILTRIAFFVTKGGASVLQLNYLPSTFFLLTSPHITNHHHPENSVVNEEAIAPNFTKRHL